MKILRILILLLFCSVDSFAVITYSTNLNLCKPGYRDIGYIECFATGMDTIDAHITALHSSSTTQEGEVSDLSASTIALRTTQYEIQIDTGTHANMTLNGAHGGDQVLNKNSLVRFLKVGIGREYVKSLTVKPAGGADGLWFDGTDDNSPWISFADGPRVGSLSLYLDDGNYPAPGLVDGDLSLASEQYSKGKLQFITSSTIRMTVALNGNVGIGTTAPLYNLHVSSTIYTPEKVIADGGFLGDLTGNSDTSSISSALAVNPDACIAGQFVNDLDADGTLTCTTPAGAGDVVLAATQTFTGQNTFMNQVAVSSTVVVSSTITVNGYILLKGDNLKFCFGDDGCADSYILFNGTTLQFKVN